LQYPVCGGRETGCPVHGSTPKPKIVAPAAGRADAVVTGTSSAEIASSPTSRNLYLFRTAFIILSLVIRGGPVGCRDGGHGPW
jgi:hypothetical protein